ncbi:hypothetical protein GCM10009712_31940 [Pseudarthrobacter sulfonivorans]
MSGVLEEPPKAYIRSGSERTSGSWRDECHHDPCREGRETCKLESHKGGG